MTAAIEDSPAVNDEVPIAGPPPEERLVLDKHSTEEASAPEIEAVESEVVIEIVD